MNTAVEIASTLSANKARPAHVQFERRPVEDKVATKREGRYIARDVDYVTVIAPYSDGKESVVLKVTQWLENMEFDTKAGRFPSEWVDLYKQKYEKWKAGQEMPLSGTPIKGWGVISPAQQEMLIARHILTVEDLAGINDVGMRAIGMGAMDLKRKAQAWLSQMGEKGPVTLKISGLEKENETLRGEVETMKRQIQELTALARQAAIQAPPPYQDPTPDESMGLKPEDFLPDDGVPQASPEPIDVPTKRKPGRPRKADVVDGVRV